MLFHLISYLLTAMHTQVVWVLFPRQNGHVACHLWTYSFCFCLAFLLLSSTDFSEERCPCAWEFRWFHVRSSSNSIAHERCGQILEYGCPRLLLSPPSLQLKVQAKEPQERPSQEENHPGLSGSTSVLCFWHLLTTRDDSCFITLYVVNLP